MMLLVILACKNKGASPEFPKGEVVGTPLYESVEFIEFYDKFGADSIFQLAQIVFPLQGTRRKVDSLDIVPEDFTWKQDGWVLHKPYDDKNETFQRSLTDFKGTVVIENIETENGQYSMERRFAKLSSGWHLIYYRELGVY